MPAPLAATTLNPNSMANAHSSTSTMARRSPAWLKLKPKLTLDVRVTGGSGDRIAWGDWGESVMLELAYKHPRTGKRASLVCWGVMSSGMLRRPLFVAWL